ncbi:MAG: glycosyltransferase family 2 protein [Candidatus Levybacteria bacterium]|nr:glycosyltransferase family 2 protein [Candidatus Levybacteria bacterium]
MKNPAVTIVILNFNGIRDTRICLKSLIKTSYNNCNILVVDNGSTKNEALILAKEFKFKNIKFIRFPKNLGFSGGNNAVIPTIKTKYITLLNNDTIVPPKWLELLIDTLEKDNSIAAVQPKILWEKNKKYFDYAGACGGFIDIFGYTFTKGRIFDSIEEDKKQYDYPCDIFWASGAAMVIRNNIFKEVGYFDERFFNYMEEIDLCYRINQAGFRIVCQPNSYIYHKVASTASKHMLKKRFWEHRNNLFLLIKNYPLNKLILIFPIRILLECLSILYYIYKRRYSFALAVILSQLSLLYLYPAIIFERIKIKRIENPRINKLIYKNSIVISYFILNKHKFSQLHV